jgi:hypothetical protein
LIGLVGFLTFEKLPRRIARWLIGPNQRLHLVKPESADDCEVDEDV